MKPKPNSKDKKAAFKRRLIQRDAEIRALLSELDAAHQIFAALVASRNINMHAYEEMHLWLQKRKEEEKA